MSITDYYKFFCDAWLFFKKYSKPMSYDSFWQVLMDEADQLIYKYSNTEFVRRVIVAITFEIERIYQENEANKNNKQS